MAKKTVLMTLGLVVSLLSVGCDKLCSKTVEDVATIQNMTGRQLSLNFCKGRTYGETLVTIPQNMNSTEVSLGSREESEVRGGPSACSRVSNSKSVVEISLSPKSFGQVKLCFDEVNKSNVIVENYQSCPTGFLEQTSTGPCN